MTTLNDLIDETKLKLLGYTQRQDIATHLTADVSANAFTLSVADGSVLTRGLIEIDNELMWVSSFDRVNNTATIAPYGRGYNGTTATAHTAGSRVTVAPTFPRYLIRTAINDAVEALYPDLFAVGSTDFPFVAVRTTYALPADTIDAQQVTWRTIGPSLEWLPVRKYRVDTMADTATWPTGKTISVYDGIVPGRMVRVTYTRPPVRMTELTDDFETTTGLGSSVREVVVLGAAYRMAAFLDAGRVPVQAVEADAVQGVNPIGSGGQVSRFLYQLFVQRLQQEQRRQQEQFQARIRITR